MKPTIQGVGLLILLATLSSALPLNAARPAPLRYRPTVGQTNVYSVRIEVQGENGNEILAGNILLMPKPGPSNLVTVTLRGTLMPRRENFRPMMGGYVQPRWSSTVYLNEGCELQIDERGRILRSAGDYPLLVPLGSVAQLLLETLPAASETRWETAESLGLMDEPLNLGPVRAFSPGQNYPIPYYGGMNPRNALAVLATQRTSKYELNSSEPGVVTIRRTSSVRTDLRNGTEPRIEASSEGSLILDRESGFLRKADIQFKSTVNTDVVTRRTTGSVQVKLLDGKERLAALEPIVAMSVPARKLAPEEIEKVLQDARSSDNNVQRQAAMKLQNADLSNAPAELLDLATNWISSDDYTFKNAGARLLADCGTKDQVPLLLKLLKQNDSMSRSTVIRGLGRLKDPRAIEPLAEVIARGSDGYVAAEVMGKLGPEAEDTVLTLLKQKHLETLRSACNILKQIGTKKSIEPLRELMLDPDQSLNSAASEAVRAIQARE
ncbi:MAG TPA: HEAT repeat domain-containing protein [Candidatus Paceibacterota bacterium]|nr:HEAT repeat domain-containing protein [Candidatus Paceibacterota bacterium]